jgi:hypothetical protein
MTNWAQVSSPVINTLLVASSTSWAQLTVVLIDLFLVRVEGAFEAWDRLLGLFLTEMTLRAHTRHTIVIQAVVTSLARLTERNISSTSASIVQSLRAPDGQGCTSRAVMTGLANLVRVLVSSCTVVTEVTSITSTNLNTTCAVVTVGAVRAVSLLLELLESFRAVSTGVTQSWRT